MNVTIAERFGGKKDARRGRKEVDCRLSRVSVGDGYIDDDDGICSWAMTVKSIT